jgi:hypothetical protein
VALMIERSKDLFRAEIRPRTGEKTTMRLCGLLFILIALASYPVLAQSSRPVQARAWETCSLTEGKGDSCAPGDLPRSFDEYLSPGAWSNTSGDSFSGDFEFDIKQPETKWKVTWNDVGNLGPHRIRQIRYNSGESSFAGLLLAEKRNGVFAPLMKWSGNMPEPRIHKVEGTDVLEIWRDFGGNVPMVQSWAWVWTERGPVRLNLAAAVIDAITKIGPGYAGYDTGMDWKTIHCRTWVWKGKYPGKVGVSDQLDAWFTLQRDRLIVKRVELRENFSEKPTRLWPK